MLSFLLLRNWRLKVADDASWVSKAEGFLVSVQA